MKKIVFLIAIIALMSPLFTTNAEASSIRGKRYYIKYLKAPCGFKGDVLGKYYTQAEWRKAYRSGNLLKVINVICPSATQSISKSKQKHIYHFLNSFASDSGNVPDCH